MPKKVSSVPPAFLVVASMWTASNFWSGVHHTNQFARSTLKKYSPESKPLELVVSLSMHQSVSVLLEKSSLYSEVEPRLGVLQANTAAVSTARATKSGERFIAAS